MKKNNTPIFALIGFIVALFILLQLIQHPSAVPLPAGLAPTPSPTQPPLPQISQTVLQQAWPVLIKNAASPIPLGDPKAPYTIIEIGDFQCPNCGKAEPIVMNALNQSKGRAKLYFYNFPIPAIHPHALIAAQAGLAAADQGKFWEMYKMLYGNQDSLIDSEIEFNSRNIPGFNVDKMKAALDSGKYLPVIEHESDIIESVPGVGSEHGIESVPTVLVKGPSGDILVYEGANPKAPNLTYPGIEKMATDPPWNK
jgi:hypothetical protein